MWRTAAAAALALLASACSDGAELSVDLKTDLVAGREFASVKTELAEWTGAMPGRVIASSDALASTRDFTVGLRVAEFADLSGGTFAVSLRLTDAGGGMVTARRVKLTLSDDFALTVLVTRDCVALACPGPSDAPERTECLGGHCVEPTCAGDVEAGCGPRECAEDADCPVAAVPCARNRCVTGVCLLEAVATRCAADERCDVGLGCVDSDNDAGTPPRMDGAVPDAMPTDTGPPPMCSGPGECNDGNGCTDDSCAGGVCSFAPNANGCDDGNPCTSGDHCSGGGCGGSGYSCDPGPCETASCDGSGGCNRSSSCGAGSVCSGGGCVPCGGADQICCGGGGCNTGLWCNGSVCTCGQVGHVCCPWDGSCEPDAWCGGGTCCVGQFQSCAGGRGPCCGAMVCDGIVCDNP